MNERITEDLAEMREKLSLYIEKGRVTGSAEVIDEPVVAVKPDPARIKPLKKLNKFDGQCLAVDCSTRTLKRANNWGIYLMRAVYALVKGRDVDWGYQEKIYTAVGDSYVRYRFLGDIRVELESLMALDAVRRRKICEGDLLLLDGPSYFGGARKFRISLYEKCKEERIKLLAISKQSPSLHDEKGRDFIATILMLSSHPVWIYHPVATANVHEHLYGDVAIVKLYENSPRAFRCDIMAYLTTNPVDDLLAPLTSLSEDPRCLGYPVTLWLAHDFSVPSDAKLLNYLDQIDKTLASAGVLDILRSEELSSNFADELHGVKYPFKREMVGDYV
jgi:hypothetical protein